MIHNKILANIKTYIIVNLLSLPIFNENIWIHHYYLLLMYNNFIIYIQLLNNLCPSITLITLS